MSNEEKIDSLEKFLEDINCLDDLNKWANNINIFDVLNITKTEIRHSNMLAWLLNPNANHNIGEYFIKRFFQNIIKYNTNCKLNIFDIHLLDYDDFQIYRERDFIDILAISPKNKIVLAIENKIDTKEHSDQLARYKEIIDKGYPDSEYDKLFVYLTPNGDDSSDIENWINCDYKVITNIIQQLLSQANELPEKTKIYLNDYIGAIRRDIMEDEELKKICRSIYFKHQKAIDLIRNNIPNIYSDSMDSLKEYLEEYSTSNDIKMLTCSNQFIRFTTSSIEKISKGFGTEAWIGNELLWYEIKKYTNGNLILGLILGPGEAERREKIIDFAFKNKFNIKGKNLKLNSAYKTIKSIILLKSEELEDLEDLSDSNVIIDNAKNRLKKFLLNDLVDVDKLFDGYNIDNKK